MVAALEALVEVHWLSLLLVLLLHRRLLVRPRAQHEDQRHRALLAAATCASSSARCRLRGFCFSAACDGSGFFRSASFARGFDRAAPGSIAHVREVRGCDDAGQT